jgi:hypothetical protein
MRFRLRRAWIRPSSAAEEDLKEGVRSQDEFRWLPTKSVARALRAETRT